LTKGRSLVKRGRDRGCEDGEREGATIFVNFAEE